MKKKERTENFQRIENLPLNWGTRNANSTTSVTTKYFYWFPIIICKVPILHFNSLLSFCIPFVVRVHLTLCFRINSPFIRNALNFRLMWDSRRTPNAFNYVVAAAAAAFWSGFYKIQEIQKYSLIRIHQQRQSVDRCRRLTDGYGDGSGAKHKIWQRLFSVRGFFLFVHSISYQSSFKSTTKKSGDTEDTTQRLVRQFGGRFVSPFFIRPVHFFSGTAW